MRRLVPFFATLAALSAPAALLPARAESPPPDAAPAEPGDRKPEAGEKILKRIEEILRARQERLAEQVRRLVDVELRRIAEEQRKRQEERKSLADRAEGRVKGIGSRLRALRESVERAIARAEGALGEKQQASPDKPVDGEKPEEAAPAPPKRQVPEAFQKLSQVLKQYEAGEYEKAIEGFVDVAKKLDAMNTAQARASRAEVYYLMACCHAALGRIEPAFQALDQAVRGGFRNVDKMDDDAELDPLREDPRFEKLYRFARSIKG